MYVGLKGSKAIITILSTNYNFNIKLDKLDKEIKQIDVQSGVSMSDDSDKEGTKYKKYSDVNYIG